MMIAMALAVAFSMASEGAAPAADVRTARGSTLADLPGYRIGPEDVLQVSVWSNEAVSRTVPVRPDGRISLPLINDVQAAGLTPAELKQEVTRRLTEFIPQPEVSVSVTDVRSLKVSVMGAVGKPGRFELKSWATVLDVLAMAEGFSEFAARSRIVVLRTNGKRVERLPFDYDKVVSGSAVNFYLHPSDIVLVP